MTTELVIRSMSLDIRANPWIPELWVDYWKARNFPLQIVHRNPTGQRMDGRTLGFLWIYEAIICSLPKFFIHSLPIQAVDLAQEH